MSKAFEEEAQFKVARRYSFEAAHFLPNVREGHKCARMHGHNYEIVVHVAGELRDDGFIIDFWELDKVVDPIVQMIDHRTLNDISGLENPTAEIIAWWFMQNIRAGWDIVSASVPEIMVECYETKDCWASAR